MAVRLSPFSNSGAKSRALRVTRIRACAAAQPEHLGVIQRAQRRIQCQAEHIVATLGERAADPLWQQARVQQKAQPLGFCDLDKREQRP